MAEPFKSELDWSPESWFSKRVAKPDGTKYTQEDVRSLRSHLQEYLNIERNSKINGTWLKMPDGTKWSGDPRSWVMMQSQAYKKNYSQEPWWTGQARWKTRDKYGDKVTRAPYHNGQMWFSNNKDYGDAYAFHYDSRGAGVRRHKEAFVTGHNFLSAIPKRGNYRRLEAPTKGTYDWWLDMPFKLKGNQIVRTPTKTFTEPIQVKKGNTYTTMRRNFGPGRYLRVNGKIVEEKDLHGIPKTFDASTHKTDDVVNWSYKLGDDGIFMFNIDDGPTFKDNSRIKTKHPIINEFISQPGFTNKVKFIEGNNGDFDINNPYKYAYNSSQEEDLLLAKLGGKLI